MCVTFIITIFNFLWCLVQIQYETPRGVRLKNVRIRCLKPSVSNTYTRSESVSNLDCNALLFIKDWNVFQKQNVIELYVCTITQ